MVRWECWLIASLVLVACAPAGCKRQTPVTSEHESAASRSTQGEWFEEVASQHGIQFQHDCGATGRFELPEIIGSGAALFDYDSDGRLDILLIQNGGPASASRNKLFHQEPDGKFRDVSAGSGLDLNGNGMGVAVGDVNNDGLPDVLLTSYGGARLFINRGDGKFEDVTHDAGLDVPGWSVSAAFCDFDRDGWLDLAIVQYVAYAQSSKWIDVAGQPEYSPPVFFAGSSTRIYRNLGRAKSAPDRVRFEDVSFACGVGRITGPGLGIVCADLDGDGWPDVLVANDGAPNRLWMNQHNFTFRDEAITRGLALNANGVPQANMGIALADLAGKGVLDVYITHLTEEANVLWRQTSPGQFEDRTAALGLASPHWRGTGFGAVFADFDNDGRADLAVVNGRVRRARIAAPAAAHDNASLASYRERNQLFHNQSGAGDGKFVDVSNENPSFCGIRNIGRGLACGDIDNDGGLDLLVTGVAEPARVYRNIAPHRGHWLLVRAIDPALGGRDAYGAHIILHAAGASHHGWVNPAYSYACSNESRVHFGLGAAEGFESIEITWPDGLTEKFDGGVTDRVIVLARGKGHARDTAR